MSQSQAAPIDERRSPRRRMLKGGVIAYSGRQTTRPCVVRDISDTGARLQVDQGTNVPDTFDLVIELDGLEAVCEVVWREDKRVGVRFLGEPRLVVPVRAQVITTPEKATLRRQPAQTKAPEPAAPQEPAAHAAPVERAPLVKTGRAIPLLIAEDDADDRFLIEDAFTQTGFEHPVTFVEDGQELLSYLRQEDPYKEGERPGLILLDLNMPKMDGRTALMHIKTDPALKRIPVIVFTTSNTEEDIERTYELGVSAFISKPNSMEEMADLVQSLNNHWMRFVALPGA